MKKAFSLLLCAALLLALNSWAAAEGSSFNASAFSDSPDYNVADGKIDLENYTSCFFDPGFSADYNCSLSPQIVLEDGGAAFVLDVHFFAGEDYGLTGILFTDSETEASAFASGTCETMDLSGGDVYHHLVLGDPQSLGEALSVMREAASRGSSCTAALTGSGNTYELEMPDEMVSAILTMNEDYNLAMSAPLPAASSGFDLSLFENDGRFSITPPEDSGNGYIDLEDYSDCFFDPGFSSDYYCIFAPDILLIQDKNPIFRLWFNFYAREPYNIDTVEIKVGDTLYTFTDIQTVLDEYDNGDLKEFCGMPVNGEIIPVLNALDGGADKEITVSLIGPEKSYTFEMTESMRAAISDVFRLFLEAGGAPEDTQNLTGFPAMTVSAPSENLSGVPLKPTDEDSGGLDLALFGSDYTITDPTETTYGYADLSNRSSTYFDPNFSDKFYCNFSPDIQLDDDFAVFRLWSYFYARENLNFDTAVFTFPDCTYTVQDIYMAESERDNGDIRQYLVLRIGEGLSGLIENMRIHADAPVMLDLVGPDEHYLFEMPASMKQSILSMYDLFLEAGGEKYLASAEENPFTVEEAVVAPGSDNQTKSH